MVAQQQEMQKNVSSQVSWEFAYTSKTIDTDIPNLVHASSILGWKAQDEGSVRINVQTRIQSLGLDPLPSFPLQMFQDNFGHVVHIYWEKALALWILDSTCTFESLLIKYRCGHRNVPCRQ